MWVWCNQIFQNSPLASSRYIVTLFSSWMTFNVTIIFPEKLSSCEPSLSFHSPAALTDLSPAPSLPQSHFLLFFILSWLVFGWISSWHRLTTWLREHQRGQKEASNKCDPGREVGEKASQHSISPDRWGTNSAAIPGFLVSLHIPTLHCSQNGF